MRVAFRGHSLEVVSSPSREAMLAGLHECKLGNVVLGEDAEVQNDFFILRIRPECASRSPFGVGICCEGHGLTPQLLLRPQNAKVVIGFNSEIRVLDVPPTRSIGRVELPSLFRCFVDVEDKKVLLVFHEIGLQALDESLEILWKYEADIIESYDIKDDLIKISFMDEPSVALRLSDGSIV